MLRCFTIIAAVCALLSLAIPVTAYEIGLYQADTGSSVIVPETAWVPTELDTDQVDCQKTANLESGRGVILFMPLLLRSCTAGSTGNRTTKRGGAVVFGIAPWRSW